MPATYADVPNNTASSWWRDTALRTNVFHCLGCCLCVFYLGYDQSLLTGLQALPRWNSYFHSPTGNILGLYAASIFLPSIFTAFIGDYISSRYGRRIAIWIGSVFIIAGALVNGLAKNPGMFIGGRVILGSGGAITKVGAPALLHEIAHPRLRPVLGAVYYGFYYTGSLTSAWLCFAGLYINSEASWRMPCLFQVLGPTLVILITATAPESPRFLIKWNKKEQAREILVKYHANGKEDDELVEWEFQEVCAALQQEANLPKSSYLDFFKTRGNRRRLIAVVTLSVGTNWVGNGIVSYYLTPVLKSVGITNASQIAGINGGLAAWNLILALLAGFNVERVGRRPIFFISFIGMFFSYVFVMGLSAGFAKTGHSAIGVAVIPFLFIYF
ncbi:hypothetical protein EHS25_001077 [Saitozyma podzolica]|uniref:Major facilitator superfamily (MFS) profile domain-containing protein n=1 Tax=Saitozyma podzolica TaxID=1890683 RepID=A0A427YHA7_9TREE|nr:hypothetical protein EHS25_001077 [Saitozyma podzolica]